MFRENRDLQGRLGEARRSAAIGAVAQGLTHNLNNLLGVVVGYLDLMKCSYDQPSMIQRSVERIDQSLGRIITVVRQLGTIANSEHEYKQSIAANALIESSIQRFNKESAALGEVRFETKVPDSVHILANQENFETALIITPHQRRRKSCNRRGSHQYSHFRVCPSRRKPRSTTTGDHCQRPRLGYRSSDARTHV